MEALEIDVPSGYRSPSQAIALRESMAASTPMSVQELVGQVRLVQEVMKHVMVEDEHYGKIPGCGDKPALLKAGAEKLGMTFRLAPTFDIRRLDMNGGHREYEIICTLNGRYQGVGACSTMEGKYRYRTGPKKSTGNPVPKAYWDLRGSNPAQAQQLIGGKGFSTMKDDTGSWVICEQGEKVEHDNPADHYNTVLKMAKKRAHVDAVLTATAASDCFIQDLDELVEAGVVEPEPKKATATTKTAPRATGATYTATPAGNGKPFKSKEQLIKLLEKNRVAAETVLREEGVLMDNETLEDYPESKLPINANQMNDLLEAVREEADKGDSGGATGVEGEFEIDQTKPGEPEGWRDIPVPFGKDVGIRFGDLSKEKLWWWCCQWKCERREFKGKWYDPKPEDVKLRAVLDQVRDVYGFTEGKQ